MAEIDLSQVKWDDQPKIDVSQVKWDEAKPKPIFGPEGFAQSVREELALQNPNPLTRMALGVSGAVDDAAMRLKQLVGRSNDPISNIAKALGLNTTLSPEEQQAVIGNRVNRENIFGLTGGVVGNMAMTGAPTAAIYRGATSAIPATANAATRLLAPTAAAAVAGGMSADATNPVLPGESENRNVGMGAAGGAAGDIGGRILGRVLQPVRPTPDAQKLIDEGVQPTLGQSAGANSWLGRLEQRIMSIPYVGDIIRSSRNRATGEFDVAAIRRALPTNQAGEVTQAGRASIDTAHNLLSKGYDQVLGRMGRLNIDAQLGQDFARIARDPDIALTPELEQRFIDLLRKQFGGRTPNGQISADVAKRVDSNLGNLVRRYTTSGDGDQRALGDALSQAQGALRQLFERQAANPADAQVLRQLNGHWANLLRVERAAGMKGATDGVFSAEQLSSAVRALDPSRNKSGYARGNALMQDLSDAGRSVLGDTVPNSQTTDRALVAALALGGAGAANEHFEITPSYVTAALLSPLLYSRLGSQAMTGQLTPGMVQALQQGTPALSNLGGYLAREQR